MLTPQQSEILTFVKKQGGESTFRQIADGVTWGYHCNGDAYIGEMIGRMVKAGLLQRPRKGVYILGTGKKSKPAVPAAASNQQSLF